MKYKPYSFWSREDFSKHFALQIEIFSTRVDALTPKQKWILEITNIAINSKEWVPSLDFNGCSVVEDRFHPCLACFIHDFLWHTGRGGRIADAMFYDLMIFDGSSKTKAMFLWAGVRTTWYLFYKWKYLLKGNVKKPLEEMIVFKSR